MRIPDPRDHAAKSGSFGLFTALRSGAAFTILSVTMLASANAQTAAAPTTPASTTTTAAAAAPGSADQPVELNAFVVNGYASSLAASLQAKR
jgi:hypothetical protein